MDLNFYANEGKNLSKFAKYNIETINNKKYIVADSSTKKNSSGAPLIDLEEQIINFVNKYSTLGLMNDFPMNKYFCLDEKIVLKDYNYIGDSDCTTILGREDYFKIFFPKCTDKELNELIEKAIKLTETSAMEKHITSDLNKLLIGSNWYCEPLDMFVQCVKYMYNLLNAIINKKDSVETKYNAFEVNHINMFLTQKEIVNIEIPITSLKQFIDFYFARTVSRDVNLLKICKFCNKAFIANNPKAEYDTPQCKNKANVYSFRKRAQEEEN